MFKSRTNTKGAVVNNRKNVWNQNYRSMKQIRDKWKENLPKEMKRRNETLENKP